MYELKDGKPSIVNFQVRNGIYVIPKVLNRAYSRSATRVSPSRARSGRDVVAGHTRGCSRRRPPASPEVSCPKGIQTWLMVALSIGIVLIILLTGQPQAPERSAAAAPPAPPMSPDRVRITSQRLQALNQQLIPPARPMLTEAPSLPPAFQNDGAPPRVIRSKSSGAAVTTKASSPAMSWSAERAPLQKTNERTSVEYRCHGADSTRNH